MVSGNAQFATDDLESWPVGGSVFGGHWTSWDNTTAAAGLASDTQAHSGSISYYIDGNGVIDGVLNLGNKTSGHWYLNFRAYVPSNKSGYYNIQAGVPIIPSWCGEFYFNRDNGSPSVGEVLNGGAPLSTFTFPHDTWFLVEMHWDISLGLSLATWETSVDGNVVIANGTPFFDSFGGTPAGLGGLDFFAPYLNNEFYIDDVTYAATPIVLGVADLEAKGFSAYPNPVKTVLNLKANEEISSVVVYNVLGQEVIKMTPNSVSSEVDMLSLSQGSYFVKVSINNATETIRIIKK